jgi:hypothetical protein
LFAHAFIKFVLLPISFAADREDSSKGCALILTERATGTATARFTAYSDLDLDLA